MNYDISKSNFAQKTSGDFWLSDLMKDLFKANPPLLHAGKLSQEEQYYLLFSYPLLFPEDAEEEELMKHSTPAPRFSLFRRGDRLSNDAKSEGTVDAPSEIGTRTKIHAQRIRDLNSSKAKNKSLQGSLSRAFLADPSRISEELKSQCTKAINRYAGDREALSAYLRFVAERLTAGENNEGSREALAKLLREGAPGRILACSLLSLLIGSHNGKDGKRRYELDPALRSLIWNPSSDPLDGVLKGEDIALMVERAALCIDSGAFETAELLLSRAFSLNSFVETKRSVRSRAHYLDGLCKLEKGELKEAERAFSSSAPLGHTRAHIELGKLAIQESNRAIQGGELALNKTEATALGNLPAARNNALDKAEKFFLSAIKLIEDETSSASSWHEGLTGDAQGEALYMLALIFEYRFDTEKARDLYRKAAELEYAKAKEKLKVLRPCCEIKGNSALKGLALECLSAYGKYSKEQPFVANISLFDTATFPLSSNLIGSASTHASTLATESKDTALISALELSDWLRNISFELSSEERKKLSDNILIKFPCEYERAELLISAGNIASRIEGDNARRMEVSDTGHESARIKEQTYYAPRFKIIDPERDAALSLLGIESFMASAAAGGLRIIGESRAIKIFLKELKQHNKCCREQKKAANSETPYSGVTILSESRSSDATENETICLPEVTIKEKDAAAILIDTGCGSENLLLAQEFSAETLELSVAVRLENPKLIEYANYLDLSGLTIFGSTI